MRRILRKIVMPIVGNGNLFKYIILGILSGLCSFLFINTVTRIISDIIAGKYSAINKEFVITFVSIILFFVWIRKTLSLKIIDLSQKIFWSLRKQILGLVLNSNYQQLSRRKNRIQVAIVSDVGILTDASINIINFFTASIMAITCLIYQASISLFLFSITAVVAMIGVSVYYLSSKRNIRNFEIVRKLENNFFENYKAIIDGFKEIYMEPKKGKFIYEHKVMVIANETYKKNTIALTGFLNNSITGQILFYILISSILLFFSVTLKIKTNDIVSFVFTLIYLFGSIETIMVLLPGLMRARVSYSHLMDLKSELEEGVKSNSHVTAASLSEIEFEHLKIRNLEFSYDEDNNAFGIGPIDLDIQKGEVIFLYGGNGSGKTTLVHTILGLCIPTSGEIRLNDILVDNESYNSYRRIFAVVFSDFYLFNEIIGIDELNIEKWNYYLKLFEMENKVELFDRSFSTTNLSTGQRKRLALINALLEEKPILVIDEWAADQDPYFRKKFYTQIIPILKKEGITIISITHDDKYYHCADKLYRMDFGKLSQENVDVFV